MESFDDLLTMLERPATKGRAVKRKWREIEAVKERQRQIHRTTRCIKLTT